MVKLSESKLRSERDRFTPVTQNTSASTSEPRRRSWLHTRSWAESSIRYSNGEPYRASVMLRS
ncbi:hypothetical protein D3C81_2259090 [compost metagenome]